MSDLGVGPFYKRVSVTYFVSLSNTIGLISFYPSVQLLKNGPKLQLAVQVSEMTWFVNRDLVRDLLQAIGFHC